MRRARLRTLPPVCSSTFRQSPPNHRAPLCRFVNVPLGKLSVPVVQQRLEPEEDLVSPLDALPLLSIEGRRVQCPSSRTIEHSPLTAC